MTSEGRGHYEVIIYPDHLASTRIFLILDLSRGECQLESPLSILPGRSVELCVYVLDLEWLLMIDGADVQ